MDALEVLHRVVRRYGMVRAGPDPWLRSQSPSPPTSRFALVVPKVTLVQMPEFHRFDPNDCNFPPPRVPLLPALQWDALAFGRGATPSAGWRDGPGVRHFARGRYALHAAYRAAGVGPSGLAILPAYHCRTMLDPALALGGDILFYALNEDLTPQLASIVALLDAHALAARVLVVPHYFGFEQPAALMTDITALCAQRGIMLIEDCSHAWQVAIQRAPSCITRSGHMLIASPYKFFACEDGGVLWGNGGEGALPPGKAPQWRNELRALRSMLARSRARRADLVPGGVAPCGEVASRGADRPEWSAQPSTQYHRQLEQSSSLRLSRWVIGRTRIARVVELRRKYYQQWIDAVAPLTGGRALFPQLPPDCAPYMFPLVISRPDPYFFLLKQAGVPMWRWDEMARSACGVAAGHRLDLLHLPCHQGLSDGQMRWLTETVAEVLA